MGAFILQKTCWSTCLGFAVGNLVGLYLASNRLHFEMNVRARVIEIDLQFDRHHRHRRSRSVRRAQDVAPRAVLDANHTAGQRLYLNHA